MYKIFGLENQTPDWAINAIDSGNNMIKGLVGVLVDPIGTFHGCIQEISDTIEEEGICYVIGLAVPEIAELLLAKGTIKVATQTVKAVDTVSDAARAAKIADALDDVGNRNNSILYGTDDIIKFEFNMIENPGPLADIQGNPASNFYGGKYNVEILTQDRIYYRGGNSDIALGQWFVAEPPQSAIKVRIDTAVKAQWIDCITGTLTGESVVNTVYAIEMPKGTTVFTGPVRSQGGVYCGAYDIMQFFINEPWKLNYKVISSKPLH